MKVLIIEPEFEGHHISLYIRSLVKEFKKNKVDYRLLTTKKTINSIPFKIIDKEFKLKKKTIESVGIVKSKNISFFNLLLYQIKYFLFIKKNISNVKKKFKFDVIYFGHLDPFFFIFALGSNFIGHKNITGLLCNIRFYQSEFKIKKFQLVDLVKKYLFIVFLKSKVVKKIFIIDELFNLYLNKNIKNQNYLKKICHVPEAGKLKKISKQENFKKEMGIKKKEKIILLYGDIKKRKGVLELLRLSENKKMPENIKVVIAGKQSREISSMINKTNFKKLLGNQVYIINKFINFEEEGKLFSISDLIWLAYSGGSDGSSGVLKQASISGKPIIESGRGLISWINDKYKIGIKIKLDNIDYSIMKISNLLLDKKKYKFFKKNIISYKKKFNPIYFSRNIYKEIISVELD